MKSVKITLDREREMRFDLNAMTLYEEVTGKSSFEIGNNMSATTVRAILYASLKDDDPNLTLKDVGNLISTKNLSKVTEKLTELLNASFGQAEEQAEGNTNRQN
jgi:uncharacterized protein with ATP-grasp and redox domains